MIAACPKCEARYRIEREKLGSDGVRLRCSKCQAVFRVRAPSSPQPPRSVAPPEAPPVTTPPPVAAETPAGAPSSVESPPAAPELTSAPSTSPPSPGSEPPGPDAPLVLVGTPDEEVGKTVRDALESWGMRAVVVRDGVEAILEIQRQQPVVAVLAPTLPRMYGFQVCEIVKRNESLQRIGVVLLGAIHHPDRYRRPPEELYGADAYVEEPDLPDALLPELRQLGVLPRAAATAPAPPDALAPPPEAHAPAVSQAEPTSPAVPAPVAEVEPPAPVESEPPRAPTEMAAPGATDELSDARAQAERLARIIVSDIVLYNEEKFAAAIESRTVVESLGPDLEEGRGLFRDRVDARIQEEKDYLTEELLRVARSRGMQ